MEISSWTATAALLCFLASSVSSVGGVGGGGLFVPILSIVAGLGLKTASGYSTLMVTGGSLANVMLSLFATDKVVGRASIDYDIALLSEPCMLLGVSLGVICNQAFPNWLITGFFTVFLTWSTVRTCAIGVVLWRQESLASEDIDLSAENSCCLNEPLIDPRTQPRRWFPWGKLAALIAIWISFFIIYFVRGNKYGTGVIHIEACGVMYWLVFVLQFPLAAIFTAWIMLRMQNSRQTEDEEEEGRKSVKNRMIISLMALFAGVLGGVFGIGGGILISPFLLQFGIPAEVTCATCSFMVFFSSTMSALQYIFVGMEHVEFALGFAVMCFVGSLGGLLVGKRVIRKYGRTSIIVFAIGAVLLLSTVLMTAFEVIGIWRDFKNGMNMGFKLPC